MYFCHFFTKLYDRRKKHVKQKEKEKWTMLNYQYMTNESDHSDIQHPLPWRSEGMHVLINEVYKLFLCSSE